MPAVNEARCADQQTNRDAHPPRSKESDYRSTNALWQWRVNETKLSEFELGEIFRGNGVTDLIVNDTVKPGNEHGENDEQNKNAEFFQDAHDAG